jgi:hypothetical protein
MIVCLKIMNGVRLKKKGYNFNGFYVTHFKVEFL